MEWTRLPNKNGWDYIYETTKDFDGDIYRVVICVDNGLKSEKFWVAVSSGKKRKQREIFEEKDYKPKAGIKGLLWIKEAIYDFPIFYGNPYNKKQYILISWSDARRRYIYARLQKEGFQFMIDNGQKCLMKTV